MIAVITMVVVFILAIGLLTLGGNVRLNGKRQLGHSGAKMMAEAGIEYGYWQERYKGATLPQTFTYTNTSNGATLKFTVTATDNSAKTKGTVLFASTGTQGRETCTLTRVLAVSSATNVFDYALCSNSALSATTSVVTGASKANGDIRANGNISLLNLSSKINGDATATGTISAWSITGKKTPSSDPQSFPAINTAYYQSIASLNYTGDVYFSGGYTFLNANDVLVINGNVNLSNLTFSGSGTIIVTGTLTVSGSITPAFSGNRIAILCLGGITFVGTGSVSGFYYAHNSSNTAGLTVNSGVILTGTSGAFAADTISILGSVALTHDSAMNTTLGQQMHLPGY